MKIIPGVKELMAFFVKLREKKIRADNIKFQHPQVTSFNINT